ncbi:MAG: SEC-C domain-containing protein [Myxococcota bacterium]
MDPKLAKHYRGRWTAGMKSFPSAHGEIVMGIVLDDEDGSLRAVSRWRLGRDMVPDLAHTIDRAIRSPIEGRPHLPAIVRVASADLAESIQLGRPEVKVEIGPTSAVEPELTRLAKDLEDDETWAWLGGDVTPPVVGEVFRAAGAYMQNHVWNELDPDQIIRLALPALGLPEAAVYVSSDGSVTGGEVVSLAIAPSRAAREAWQDDHVPPDEIDVFFYDRDDVPEAAWGEVKAHGWAATEHDQYPRIVAGGEDERPPTARELAIATAVLDALAGFFAGEAETQSDPEAIVEREVKLPSGDVAKVRVDPSELLEGGDDEDEEDMTDAELEELEADMLEDEAFLDLDDQNEWPPAAKAASATVRAPVRPGRNDVCWCGSGKKYKKCHLDEDAAKDRA